MDMESPFPNTVRMDIRYYVGKFYVLAFDRTTYQGGKCVMMRPFPTYDEARAFQYSHTGR